MANDLAASRARRVPRLAAAATVALLGSATWVSGAFAGPATYYASPGSTDSTGSCPSSAPCTLDHAVAVAAAGDVVILEPGTYTLTHALTASIAITIEGAPDQARPTVTGAASLTGDTVSISGGAVVRHLDIAAANQNATALSLEGATAEDLIVTAGSPGGAGEALSIKDSAAGTVARTVLAVADGADAEAVSFKDGTSPGTASVSNLTAIGLDGATAISGNVAAGTVTVENSIASGSGGDISIKSHTHPIGISYSGFEAAASGSYLDQGHNLSEAPVFVDVGAGNFREAANSPTIDAGTADPALSVTDLDGNSRTSGSAPDMGAYEYVPGSGTAGGSGTGSRPSGGSGSSGSGSSGSGPAGSGSRGSGATGGAGQGGGSAGSGGSRGHGGLPPASAPVAGHSVTLVPLSGIVHVELPRTHTFIALAAAAQIPVGTVIDATNGTVRLRSAVSSTGATKTGTFSGGRFVVRQATAARPVSRLRLVGGSFAACSAASGLTHGVRLAARQAPRVVRQLWGSDHGGRFATIGRSASAAVRGTVWLTQDRCDGTLIRVFKGRVVVHDAVRRRNVIVRAGHAYLARAHA